MSRLYEENLAIIERQVAEHAYITPIAQHRNPDGTINVAQFKEKWEKAMAECIRIPLWEAGKTPNWEEGKDPLQNEPYMVFLPADTEEVRGTILVAHGGGFEIRTGGEGPNVAWHFHKLGYNTAILTYRLLPYTRFDAIDDMQRAIRILRARKDELHISDKITVMGFSAGGMLSGNCATLYKGPQPEAADPIDRENDRPDACVMSYAAFTGASIPRPFMMPGMPLTGDTLEERFTLAVEKNINPQTPPFFVWQTLSDDGRLGLILCRSLNEAEVPYELHIFDDGEHGVGLADGENDLAINSPHVNRWAKLCDEFLQKHGVK